MSNPSNLPARLKELRAARGVTQDQLAEAVKVSKSLVAAFETARLVPVATTAAALDRYFGTGDEIQALSAEARRNRRPSAPAWFQTWRDAEETATTLRYYQATMIPGLLQTEAYARAVFSAGLLAEDEVAAQVALRMERQALILGREDRPALVFMLDAAALRCPPDIAKDQLAHLVDVSASRPNVIVHVIPDTAGLHAGRAGSFALATTDDGVMIGLTGDIREDRVIMEPGPVADLDRTWHAIGAVALPCDQSTDLILRLVDQ